MPSKTSLLSNAQISAFCQQVAMILNAGISTYEGISILLEHSDPETKELLLPVFHSLEQGNSFSDALSAGIVFPSYMIRMIHLGEETGKLEEVLSSLSIYYEREDSIRESIRHAVTYPLIMTVLMLIILFVLIAKVLPVFQHIYAELGSDLTGTARSMMLFSTSLNKYIVVVLIVVFLLLAAAALYLHSQKGRLFLAGRSLSIEIASSRFSNVMALVLSSGLDTDQGLVFASELIENPVMEARIKACQSMTATGSPFTDAMCKTGIFSGIHQSMLTVGAKTGSLDSVMEKLSVEFEKSADYRISRFISTLEPALVITLSVVIGMIMLTFLVPLIGIMSVLG